MSEQKTYALIGAGGYIAPRHMEAIKATGGRLAAAMDASDSVGILDRHFPQAEFFTDFELFFEWLMEARGTKDAIDTVVVCSPNHLHRAHIAAAFHAGCDAICEKPLVLDPADLDRIAALQRATRRSVHSILQLRLHEAVRALKQELDAGPADRIHDIELDYITSRGPWYRASWKNDLRKSGGVATNIGVHFFDMLSFLFGRVVEVRVDQRSDDTVEGSLTLERARVRWMLSIDAARLPAEIAGHQTTYRALKLDGREFEFSSGFTELHTESYRAILRGEGFGLDTVRPSIEIVSAIAHMDLTKRFSPAA